MTIVFLTKTDEIYFEKEHDTNIVTQIRMQISPIDKSKHLTDGCYLVSKIPTA